MPEPIVPIAGQAFASQSEWIRTASHRLTRHPDYRNTEHDGPEKGWRGHHFTALCFDQKGRRCRNGADFRLAEEEGTYPVWWVWPDQIAGLLMGGFSSTLTNRLEPECSTQSGR